MEIIIGIDIGGSTTKIVAFSEGNKVLRTLQVKASDQLTSLYGAIGHLLYQCGLSLGQVSRFVITGVGASFLEGDIFGIPTLRVKEFEAIGRGGLQLSGLPEALVASVGTGTVFVQASQAEIRHLGGSGVGGGTLLGLSAKLFGESDVEAITALAAQGDLSMVDLGVGEISNADIPSLPSYATASNFGKIKSTATHADMALGLMNMIFQTVGTLAVFANPGAREIVVTGSLATLPQAKLLLDQVGELYGVRFLIPEGAAFATAIGAASLHLNR